LWTTDTIHGVDIGWVTLIIVVMMAMPKVGGILTPGSWSGVPVQTLLFLTAAVLCMLGHKDDMLALLILMK